MNTIPDQDAAVRALYERYPYPPPLKDIAPFVSRTHAPGYNPIDSWGVFFPERPYREEIDVLIAGCGTRTIPMFAAYMPKARFWGIDISEQSLAVSQAQVDHFGLKNVTLAHMPLEQVSALGRDFDWIHSHGVLHHLADPAEGLRRLKSVLRPEGAMSLMVYATYGRTGVYMLQELCERLGLSAADAPAVKALIRDLPIGHPINMIAYGDQPEMPIEEVADLFLHPRDVSYTVEGVRDLVAAGGVQFHRWLTQGQYDHRLSAIGGHGLADRLKQANHWQRSAAAELSGGRIIKHSFCVTHPSRKSAKELFAGAALVDARVTRCRHIHVHVDKATKTVNANNTLSQIPLSVTGTLGELGRFLSLSDGSRSVGQVVLETLKAQGLPVTDGAMTRNLKLMRSLYKADILELQVV